MIERTIFLHKNAKIVNKEISALIMAVAMIAMLAFGGTYAYFTAQATSLTSVGLKTGKVALSTDATVETVFTNDKLLPGDALIASDIAYTVDTTDTEGNYVTVRVTLDSAAEGLVDAIMNEDFTIGTGWTQVGQTTAGVAIYQQLVTTGTATIDDAKFIVPLTFGGDGSTITDASKYMEKAVTVTIEARSIQASHLGETGALTVDAAISALWSK